MSKTRHSRKPKLSLAFRITHFNHPLPICTGFSCYTSARQQDNNPSLTTQSYSLDSQFRSVSPSLGNRYVLSRRILEELHHNWFLSVNYPSYIRFIIYSISINYHILLSNALQFSTNNNWLGRGQNLHYRERRQTVFLFVTTDTIQYYQIRQTRPAKRNDNLCPLSLPNRFTSTQQVYSKHIIYSNTDNNHRQAAIHHKTTSAQPSAISFTVIFLHILFSSPQAQTHPSHGYTYTIAQFLLYVFARH